MSAIPALRVLSPPTDLPPPEILTGVETPPATPELLRRRVPHPEGLLAAYFAIDRSEDVAPVAKLLFASRPDAKSDANLRAYNELYSAARGEAPPVPMEFSVEEFRALHAVLSLRKLKPQIPQVGGFLATRAEILAASGLQKAQRPGRTWAQYHSASATRRVRALQDLAIRQRPLLVVSHPGKGQTQYAVRYAPVLKVSDLATWDENALETFPPQLHQGKTEGKFWLRLHPALETRFHRLLDEDYIEQLDRLKGASGRLSSYEIVGVWWCYLQWKPVLEIHRDKLARKLRIPDHQIARRPSVLATRMQTYYKTWMALGLLLDFEMGRPGRDGIKDFFRFNPDKLLHLRDRSETDASPLN
ncbi:MAG: hypothetical protein HYR88_08395 [Verrucomicrobia bacterium]|nr:hypothetical protein [Verrucomicrobiota bacterium]